MTLAKIVLAAALCTASLLAHASLAHASEPVLVVPALTQGRINQAVADQLEVRLHEVVRESDLALIVASNALARRAAACADDDCRAQLIAKSGAQFLLVPEIILEDEDYTLRLTLYAASGSEAVQIEDTCGLCGLAEAVDLMGDLGARLGRKVAVATRTAVVEVLSTPPGASVLIGGELVGTTPFELPLDAGAHHLRLQLDGYIGLGRDVEVVAGESMTLDLELQRLPPKPALDRKMLLGFGWGAIVAGFGGVVGGATLMAIDERPIRSDCAGANVDINGTCRWRYATLTGGVSLVAIGAVLIGTGVALLVARRKTFESSSAVRVRPTLTGFALQF